MDLSESSEKKSIPARRKTVRRLAAARPVWAVVTVRRGLCATLQPTTSVLARDALSLVALIEFAAASRRFSGSPIHSQEENYASQFSNGCVAAGPDGFPQEFR